MILLKSLIVLFVFLLLAQFFKPTIIFFARKFFDPREGFTQIEEIQYTRPTVLKKHKEMSMDAKMLSDLQEKMNELLQLSEKAKEINIKN